MTECGENFKIFSSGESLYPHLMKLIAGAQCEVLISVYAFHNDATGRKFAEVLSTKAREGVKVRVLFDCLGSWGDRYGLLSILTSAGVQARLFRRRESYVWRRPFSFLYRNHSRLFLVDRTFFGVGGLGIGDIYMGREDCFLVDHTEHGDVFAQLFEALWALAETPGRLPAALSRPFPVASGIQGIVSGPYRGEQQIYEWLLLRIRAAKKRIVLVTTWFFPTKELLHELLAARSRGVTVTLVTPLATDRERYDAFRTIPLSRVLRRICWYGTATYFHQKYYIIDDEWCMGSANFDIISLCRDYELDVCGRGGKVLAHLEENFRRRTAGKKPKTTHPALWIFRNLWRLSYRVVEFFLTADPVRGSSL
jgi:cardiolipin synthase